jgi:hypothetical protein
MFGPVLVSLVGESELLLVARLPVSRLGMSGESPFTSICSSLLLAGANTLLLLLLLGGLFHHSSPSPGRLTYLQID